MLDLSIIIINYNTFELTSKCIASIYQFTSGLNYEIILVDNNSGECDPQKFKEQFPKIILIENNENVGFARGNNIAIGHSIGRNILLLNSDTELFENTIGECYTMLTSKLAANVGVITCKLMFPDGRIQHQCGRFPSIKLQLVELLRIQKLLPKRLREKLLLGGFFDNESHVYPEWIWGTFFMFRRKVLETFPNSKLTETYFMYVEDIEWCYTIHEAGWKIYFNPSVTIVHHAGSSSISLFGESLNPMIKSNFRDLIVRKKGKILTSLYFFISRINKLITFKLNVIKTYSHD